MDQSTVSEVQDLLAGKPPLMALTGAGCSAESGVPTFRGPDGLWRNHRPEELATPEAFQRNPELVWEWYGWRRKALFSVEPNAAHYALARAQDAFDDISIITQNVDGLHQAAGSREVIELHGNIWRVFDPKGDYDEYLRVETLDPPLPRCPQTGHLLRPGVVWFGEALPEAALRGAERALERCNVVLVIGTSGMVYPAAQLPLIALERGATIVEVNPDPTPLTPKARYSFRGKAWDIVPQLLAKAIPA